MSKCPICQTPYVDSQAVHCSICAWDLTQYPLTLEGVYADKQAKINWAKQVWANLQKQSKQSEISLPIGSIVSTNRNDYTYLWELLTAGKWESANYMTRVLMLRLAERDQETEDYFDQRASENFPASDLKIIDGLWVKYSEGRFGFSVQKKIGLKIRQAQSSSTHNVIDSIVRASGNMYRLQEENNSLLEWAQEFKKQVGWEKELVYDLKQPQGHLPCIKRKLVYPQHLMPKVAIIAARNLELISGLYKLLMREEL